MAKIFQNISPLLYKLSCDTLFILLVFFVLVLIAEGLLPGIVSSHIGLYKIAIVICANIFSTLALRNHLPAKKEGPLNRYLLWIILGILLLLIFNSLISLPIFLSSSILILSGAMIFYIFKVFEEEK
jgi:hypothetical protein